jgi:hypothetical protein
MTVYGAMTVYEALTVYESMTVYEAMTVYEPMKHSQHLHVCALNKLVCLPTYISMQAYSLHLTLMCELTHTHTHTHSHTHSHTHIHTHTHSCTYTHTLTSLLHPHRSALPAFGDFNAVSRLNSQYQSARARVFQPSSSLVPQQQAQCVAQPPPGMLSLNFAVELQEDVAKQAAEVWASLHPQVCVRVCVCACECVCS